MAIPRLALTEDEAADATRLRLVMARLLVGDVWRPETRGMLYELAARAQQHYPADWEQRLATAYVQARDGLAPGDVPVSAADEHAIVERLRQALDASSSADSASALR
jgi:hypothetical protein